jgi:ribosomal protein S17E
MFEKNKWQIPKIFNIYLKHNMNSMAGPETHNAELKRDEMHVEVRE